MMQLYEVFVISVAATGSEADTRVSGFESLPVRHLSH